MPDEPFDQPDGDPPATGEEADTRAKSVPLPAEEGDAVIAQQNAGADIARGSGEWPAPDAAPREPAPGTTPEGEQAASRRAQAPPQRPPAGTASQPEVQQDATTGGDRGPARTADTAAGREGPHHPSDSFKPALDADPLAGGSQSGPDEDEEVGPTPGRE